MASVDRMNFTDTAPVTEGRRAVRGLAASKRRSTSRLKVIAQVRAITMQARISPSRPYVPAPGGHNPAA